MKTFSSVAAVMGLWLAVSFLLWLCYRLFRSRDGSRQKGLAATAIGLIDEGAALFGALRKRASGTVTSEGSYRLPPGQPEETLREDVRSLLNAIEAKSVYFDHVNAAKKKIQKTFGITDFLPLSEILQIRRDFWAASEIFLIDDVRNLGPELAEAHTYETLQAEACALLFKDGDVLAAPGPEDRDAVEIRLAIAHEEAIAFSARVEQAIAAELEKSRFPTPAEVIAGPWSLIRGIAVAIREAGYLLNDAGASAQSLARTMRSKGVKGAAEELRRTRGDLPGQFATAFERAGGIARKGGEGLKRHYEFVLEAQELRARYAELLSRAPDVTEKGKQFLTRLELERRAEQFRETSGDAVDWTRQKLVVLIAYLITALQYTQAKITPPENKQLVARPAEPEARRAPAASEAEAPLRVLLLPASAYAGGSRGYATGRARGRPRGMNSRPRADPREPIYPPRPKESQRKGRLRDLVTGDATLLDEDFTIGDQPLAKKPREETKPRFSHSDGLKKTSFKDLLAETAKDAADDSLSGVQSIREAKQAAGRGTPTAGPRSLLDRLSSLDAEEQAGPPDSGSQIAEPKSKGGFFGLFKSKRT